MKRNDSRFPSEAGMTAKKRQGVRVTGEGRNDRKANRMTKVISGSPEGPLPVVLLTGKEDLGTHGTQSRKGELAKLPFLFSKRRSTFHDIQIDASKYSTP